MQINLMLSKVDDIKQVVGIREMAFPLFWFESVSWHSWSRFDSRGYIYLINNFRVSTNCRKMWSRNWKWWPRCRKLLELEFLTQCSVWAASCYCAWLWWSGSGWRASLMDREVWATPTSSLRNERTELLFTRRPTVKVGQSKSLLISPDKSCSSPGRIVFKFSLVSWIQHLSSFAQIIGSFIY